MKRKSVMPKHRKAEYIFSIIANLVFLYILSKVPSWDLSFLKSGYMVILTIMQINCLMQIAGNIAMIVIDTIFFRHMVKIILDSASIVIMVLIYYIYPFNFAATSNLNWLDNVLPFVLIIGIILTGFGIISNLFKMFAREDELV